MEKIPAPAVESFKTVPERTLAGLRDAYVQYIRLYFNETKDPRHSNDTFHLYGYMELGERFWQFYWEYNCEHRMTTRTEIKEITYGEFIASRKEKEMDPEAVTEKRKIYLKDRK